MREKAAFGRLALDTATGVTVCLCMHVEEDETFLRGERVPLRQAVMIRRWRDVVTHMTLGTQCVYIFRAQFLSMSSMKACCTQKMKWCLMCEL